ncbi:MAG: transposase [Alphaproteobacteria bacterium]|nr:transposase [Alphaproteobacteria bacterium]
MQISRWTYTAPGSSSSLSTAASKIYKGKSRGKLKEEFQGLRKRYLGQHLWTSGYFVAMSRQISAKDVRKYIEAQEVHHKYNNFRISEF